MHIPTTKLQIFFDLRKRMREYFLKSGILCEKTSHFSLFTFYFSLFFVLLHTILRNYAPKYTLNTKH